MKRSPFLPCRGHDRKDLKLEICAGQRALRLLCAGRAHVVHEEEGNFGTYTFDEWCLQAETRYTSPLDHPVVHSVSLRVYLPRVILLHVFDRLPAREVKFSRDNVFRRDRHVCQYCGNRFESRHLNLDHVTPRNRGGQTSWTNVVCSCRTCNAAKGSQTPSEAGMTLLSRPRKPRWRPFVETQFSRAYHQSWRHFLDHAGWRVDLGES